MFYRLYSSCHLCLSIQELTYCLFWSLKAVFILFLVFTSLHSTIYLGSYLFLCEYSISLHVSVYFFKLRVWAFWIKFKISQTHLSSCWFLNFFFFYCTYWPRSTASHQAPPVHKETACGPTFYHCTPLTSAPPRRQSHTPLHRTLFTTIEHLCRFIGSATCCLI